MSRETSVTYRDLRLGDLVAAYYPEKEFLGVGVVIALRPGVKPSDRFVVWTASGNSPAGAIRHFYRLPPRAFRIEEYDIETDESPEDFRYVAGYTKDAIFYIHERGLMHPSWERNKLPDTGFEHLGAQRRKVRYGHFLGNRYVGRKISENVRSGWDPDDQVEYLVHHQCGTRLESEWEDICPGCGANLYKPEPSKTVRPVKMVETGFEHISSTDALYTPSDIVTTMSRVDRIVISAPHTVPDSSDVHMYDTVSARVASLLGSHLEKDLPVELIINRTEKRSDIDLNREPSRDHPYRRRIARRFSPKTLFIDVHSYPTQTPIFGQHDVALIAPGGIRTQLMTNIEHASEDTGLDLRILPYPSRKCDTTVHAMENDSPALAVEVNEKFKGREDVVAKKLADSIRNVILPFRRLEADNMLTYDDYKEAIEGEGWAIHDYKDMISRADTEKEEQTLKHIRDEELEHVDELHDLMGFRGFRPMSAPPEKLSDWALIGLAFVGAAILANLAGNR